MNASIPNRPTALLRISVAALFTAMFAIAGCAGDATAPRTVRPNFSETDVQDEDLVPESDLSNPGNWEPNGSLWAQMDEGSPNDDTDYIYKNRLGLPATTSAATVELTDPVGGTPSSSQALTLKVRWKVTGNYSTTTPLPTILTYTLLEGTTVIATGSLSPSSSYVTGTRALLQSEINNISNYPALRIKLEATLKPASDPDQIQARVTWARLEIR